MLQKIKFQKAGYIYALLFFMLYACIEQDIETLKRLPAEQVFPAEVSQEVEMIYSDSAIIKAILTAPLMERYVSPKEQIIMPNGLLVIFYERDLKETSRLRAEYGIRHENENLTEVMRDVLVINIDGDSMMTEHLVWDETKDEIHSDAFVKVITAEEIIMSEGFKSNVAFTDYEFYNIRGIINIDTGEDDEAENTSD
jgi:LPS export ABC transporter protein LptC